LWDNYNRFASIISFLDSTVSENPSIAGVEVIGKSYQNQDLKLIKIGLGQENRNKPVIFMNSGLHAREWIGPAFTTYLIQQLVDGYKSGDSDITSLLSTFDWYILPVANPDGYEYTHTTVSIENFRLISKNFCFKLLQNECYLRIECGERLGNRAVQPVWALILTEIMRTSGAELERVLIHVLRLIEGQTLFLK